jgi:hypothetical protein
MTAGKRRERTLDVHRSICVRCRVVEPPGIPQTVWTASSAAARLPLASAIAATRRG